MPVIPALQESKVGALQIRGWLGQHHKILSQKEVGLGI